MSRTDDLMLLMMLLIQTNEQLERQAEEALALQTASDALITHLTEECELLYQIALLAKAHAVVPGPTQDETERLFALLKEYEAWTEAHGHDVLEASRRLEARNTQTFAMLTRPPRAQRRRTKPSVTSTV